MSLIAASTPRAYVGTPRRGPVTRLLEDERWLAMLLLLPTVVLLGLFIAYPFVKGIMLSVTDTRVGVPGHFVGAQNFINVWHDGIFRVAVWNTCVYTAVATIVTGNRRGQVTWRKRCQARAPSIAAASWSSGLIVCNPARRLIA